MSVVPEARLLRDLALFMHDPTEGGVIGGISEIVALTDLKVKLDFDAFPLHPITRKASKILGFDPLHLISSGALLAVVSKENAEEAMNRLKEHDISCTLVGTFDLEGMGTDELSAEEELWRLLGL